MAEHHALAVLHVHTDWSHDGRDSLAAVAAFAARERLRYVFLTDHAEDFDSARFLAYLQECEAHSTPAHQIVPGLEFRFEGYPGLHLLAVGLRQWISPASPEGFCQAARAHAEFLVMAHPLLTRYQVPESVLGQLHGVEVWNAQYNTRYLPDGKAIAFWSGASQRWPHLIATAGTDQHRLQVEGRVRLRLPVAGDPFHALREGTFDNQGLTMTFSSRPAWGPGRLKAIGWLRILLERVKRWRNRHVRQAGGSTSSR